MAIDSPPVAGPDGGRSLRCPISVLMDASTQCLLLRDGGVQ
jgi:hypothetical protein